MRRAYFLISGAWLLHAISWFHPVVKGEAKFPDGLPGWQAFRYASSAVWPFDDGKFIAWYYAVLATGSAVTTLLFIFGSPWIVLRESRLLGRVSAWAAATAFVVNAQWYVLSGSDRRDLRIGYFLWWFSFLFVGLGLFDPSTPRADK